MTDKQLAELEARERAERAERMEQAMKAVAFVSQIKYPHPATYEVRQKSRSK